MTLQIVDMMSSSFFWRFCVALVKFRYWSKFHVNTMNGSGVMKVFVCKRLTRNPETGNQKSHEQNITENFSDFKIVFWTDYSKLSLAEMKSLSLQNLLFSWNWAYLKCHEWASVYLGPCQTIMMELFCRYSYQLKIVHYFRK